MGQLVAGGHELTNSPDQADIIVVNTCSFIDPAKQESVDTILEMAEYKRTGVSYSLDTVFDGLRRMTDARRAELEPGDLEAEPHRTDLVGFDLASTPGRLCGVGS